MADGLRSRVVLTPRYGEVSRRVAAEEFLDRWTADRMDDALVWATRPRLHIALTGRRSDATESHHAVVVAHLRRSARSVGRTLPGAGRRGGSIDEPELRLVGPLAFVWRTTNQQRALEPVIRACATALRIEPRATVVRSRPSDLFSGTRRAFALARQLCADAERDGWEVDPGAATDLLLTAARDQARAAALVRRTRTSCVVVSNQHIANCRTVLAEARRAGVRSAYIPHAPATRMLDYLDLPCDDALLRGPGEVEHYAALGARRSGMPVVGNPAIGHIQRVPIDPDVGPVLAVRPSPFADLTEIMDLCGAAWPVGTVAAHPRSDRAALARIIPPGWRLFPGSSTVELLERGPFAVIQHSSGIGWEALAMGLPVVQLDFPGRARIYPFLDADEVVAVNDDVGLRAALEELHASAPVDHAAAARRVALARHWASAAGTDAACAAAEVLLERCHEGAGEPVLDGWTTGVASAAALASVAAQAPGVAGA